MNDSLVGIIRYLQGVPAIWTYSPFQVQVSLLLFWLSDCSGDTRLLRQLRFPPRPASYGEGRLRVSAELFVRNQACDFV